MDVSVRDLRNSTASVIAAVRAGQQVTLTVYGEPVADIVPRHQRRERLPTRELQTDLAHLAQLANDLGIAGETDLTDYDSGLTSDDF